jgi:glycosyltransferase involved in cell wall biosynthesis
MRIALVVHDFDPRYGQGRYCYELARRLGEVHEIEVYSDTFAGETLPGVHWTRVPAWRRRALTTIFSFLVAAKGRIRRGAHDVVHAQGLTCWGADVITAHICTAARADQLGRGRPAAFARAVVPWERRFYRHRRARHLIAVSGRVEGEIRRWYGWTRPSAVIHHGTDTTRFRPFDDAGARSRQRAHLGFGEGAWHWLFVGESVKGLSEGIAQLPAFPRAHLWVISRSDPTAHREQARARGVEQRVHFMGPQEPDRVYPAADAFIYPSRYDAFGMVVTEAMASGVPVVVGRNIGAAELIQDGENGLLCDPEAPETLRAALARLSGDPHLAARLGEEARRTVTAHDWDACAMATECVYRRAAEDAAA